MRDVEKKKEEIRNMYQESLEQNLKVINTLKTIVKQKMIEIQDNKKANRKSSSKKVGNRVYSNTSDLHNQMIGNK